ncbi:YheC/YheD family protein [Rossellomorea aquimaris]|uniref:YheC/YheD family endospore coat-associated protein n=1 Tax=Rossellomorea aquimaris TaxID=189382 RepID=UPI001CD2F349|nr:YheC/YheD family protein [Rossellomorea aquimaris]MCA1056494.1 YheC/YheD family protein [Rossellomorea aquimaris]
MMYKCSLTSFMNHEDNEIILPQSIFNRLDGKKQITLMAGASPIRMNAVPAGSGISHITLKTTEPAIYSIPEMSNILVKVNPEQHSLSIGPVTALLIDDCPLDRLHGHSLTKFFTECEQWFRQQGGVFYLLPVSSLLKNEMTGFMFIEDSWQTCTVPLPNVLYNRSHSRKIEKLPHYDSALTYMDEQAVHVFNSSFLSKDIVYRALQNNPELHPHLPDTVKGLERLDEMLKVYGDVFIKGINGSKGRYIIRVLKREKDYLVYQNSFSPERMIPFNSFDSLQRKLQSWCRSSTYIVQQTIPFLTMGKNPLDFRFLCHKDLEGDWKVISAVARIAHKDQFVSNIDQGGRMESPPSVLQSLFPGSDSRSLYSDMKSLSIAASASLSKHLRGHYAEFGIDIGVDREGKPWIIEINSKPSKKTFVDNERIRPSVKALYEYSFHIWKAEED